jgi:hypothetical protein
VNCKPRLVGASSHLQPVLLDEGRQLGRAPALSKAVMAICDLCPPLFPLIRCCKGGATVAKHLPCTRQQASD